MRGVDQLPRAGATAGGPANLRRTADPDRGDVPYNSPHDDAAARYDSPGNLPALEAVLADGAAAALTRWWSAGTWSPARCPANVMHPPAEDGALAVFTPAALSSGVTPPLRRRNL